MKGKRIPAALLAAIICVTTALSGATALAADTGVNNPEIDHVEGTESEISAFQQDLLDRYVDPDRVYSTDMRWWLGETSHTVETLMEEVQALYDAGFRGVELCMQSDDDNNNNATYAWGSEMWSYKWKLLMNKILDLDMGLYLTSGTNWATTNVPSSYLDPDSQSAMQAITVANTTVNAGASLTSLSRATSGNRSVGQFIGAYAYRILSGNNVDLTSMIDLTPLCSEGANWYTRNLNWTNNSDEQYRVFSYWVQGTAQTASPGAETCYTVNYFDKRGVETLKKFWNENILDDEELNVKIFEGDVQLFLDSLEINDSIYWSEDFQQEFMSRKGYDIRPYLFLTSGATASVSTPYNDVSLGTYRLDGEETLNRQYVTDYLDVKNQLYQEYYLKELKEWMNSVGIKVRSQISYGRAFEISEPIMYVDYPEAEGLNQYNQVDIYRLWSGGAKLQNKVLSSETSTQFQMQFGYTHQYRLRDVYSLYAAGFQRIIWHVWTAQYGVNTRPSWPGYLPAATIMNYTKLDTLGTRFPSYNDYDEFNAHIGRVSQLVQEGKARSDIGFIHNNWTQGVRYGGGTSSTNIAQTNWQLAHQGIYYRSTELQDNGYTYDYFSPRFLYEAPEVYFDQETRTIEPAGYKAIVLYQPWLELQGAERVLEWARQGLKVVILDDAASYTISASDSDADLKAVIDQMKELDTVRTATTADPIEGGVFASAAGGYDNDVLEILQELDVYPYAEFAEENQQLLTQTRQDEDGNMYLYIYNYCSNDFHDHSWRDDVRTMDHGTNIQTEIKMDGIFIPYSIDAWSGKVTELGNYRYENGRTVFAIDLDHDNIALFALEAIEEDNEKLHIVSTDAESAYAAGNNLMVRATETGLYETVLSNGTSYANVIEVPQAYDITDWDLTVTSWTDGGISPARTETLTMPSGTEITTDNYTRLTTKTDIDVTLDKLTTWNNIPEIGENISGIGHYQATFTWNSDAADGAYLDFGDKLFEGMKVWINGQKVGGAISTNPTKEKKSVGEPIEGVIPEGKDTYTGGVSWTKPIVDISEYLVDGENEIIIDYSSNLTNALIAAGQRSVVNNAGSWWGYNIYRYPLGPKQAVIIPFVEEEITVQSGDGFKLSTDAYLVEQDGYANITTEFVELANSNTAIINYTFNTDRFKYADFHLADGVQLISKEATDYGAKIVVMIPSYDTQTYGRLAIQAISALPTGWAVVKAEAEYVVLDESGAKEIKTTSASTAFTTLGDEDDDEENPLPKKRGDTNNDGVVDLIDLSNMIDWFGIDNTDFQWKKWHIFFDFNNNGEIDIYDIVTVAQLIK